MPGQPATRGEHDSALSAGQGSAEGMDVAAAVRHASRGDEQAWAAIVQEYSPRMYAMVRSRLRNDDAASEIVQSVFLTLSQTLLGSDDAEAAAYEERGRFESWLFRIVMNRVRDEARRRGRQAVPTDPHTVADARDTAHSRASAGDESGAGLEELRAAMEGLGDADREVVELRHHGGMSFQEISGILDQPVGTVLARHHRALKKLKVMMKESICDA